MVKASELTKQSANIPKRFLSVRVYRHYGSVDVEFGVSAEYQPMNDSGQSRIWWQLHQQVMDMHDEWAQNQLPNIPHIQPPVSTPTSKPESIAVSDTAVYAIDKIGYDERKNMFAIFTTTPPYAVHPVYVPDAVSAAHNLENRYGRVVRPVAAGGRVFINGGRVCDFEDLQ